MCYKLVDDESGNIVCRSVIRSATEPGTANFRIDPIKPLPPDAIHNTEPNAMLDELMTMADLKTSLSHLNEQNPVDSIPASTKSKTWQEMERNKQVEHQEDLQQRSFHSSQPKFSQQQYQYQTRSKTAVNEAETAIEKEARTMAKDKEFIFLRDKGEKVTPVFKQFEFIFLRRIWGATFRPIRKGYGFNWTITKRCSLQSILN